ncbi:hypothetical protein F2P56_037177 [Juglans regia]|uniref:Uncharacterized protein n=1 Tax=Juglans regia TaxID=51240 RepID=A0A833T2J2_JUGRE|nr:hypothetical protein F2P56_037177 [Juglans regia]
MTTFMGGTVLHAAVDAEQQEIVMELVNMMSEHDLAMKDNFGYTALHISGNQKMAECLIRKNKELVSIRNKGKLLPVALAMSDGHKELARYLYSQTPFQDLEADRDFNGASLLNSCFYQGDLDMALDLMERCPRLAFALDGRRKSPLEVLAEISTDAFEQSGNYKMVFWKQWIYNHCIHISLDRAADQFRLNIQNHGEENSTGPVGADLWRQLVSSLFNLSGCIHAACINVS